MKRCTMTKQQIHKIMLPEFTCIANSNSDFCNQFCGFNGDLSDDDDNDYYYYNHYNKKYIFFLFLKCIRAINFYFPFYRFL